MKFLVWQGECHIHLGRNVFLSKITNRLFQIIEIFSIELHLEFAYLFFSFVKVLGTIK